MSIFFPPPPQFIGGAQPYAPPQKLSPWIIFPDDNPPIITGGPFAQIYEIVTIAQPNPWTYATGGIQPYGAGKQLSPSLLNVPPPLPPPNTLGGPTVLQSEIVGLQQPDPWSYVPMGGKQPYSSRVLPANLLNNPPSNPPITQGGPTVVLMAVVSATQPDPWTYNFLGNLGPYIPRKVSPGITGFSVDLPPKNAEAVANSAQIIAQCQPPTWGYYYFGAWQPYTPKLLAPAITRVVPVNPPGMIHPGRSKTIIPIVQTWQPDPWTYTFMGGMQPFAPTYLNPSFETIPPPPGPGAGKKPGIPPYIPEAPWGVRAKAPAKSFRPIWDKPKEPPATPAPVIEPKPVAVPPSFLVLPSAPPISRKPPSFQNLMPNAQVGAIPQQIKAAQDATDQQDIMNLLKQLGYLQ